MKKNSELIIVENNSLLNNDFGKKHEKMINLINQKLPYMEKSTMNFNKTQSQFMDNVLTVNHLTPIRNVRQILAECVRIRDALDDAKFELLKKQIKIKRIKFELKNKELDRFDREEKIIEQEQLQVSTSKTLGYVSGAIRKLANYAQQYENIMKSIGKKSFTEKDFEEEEERYHIMTAFNQALNAARSHGGVIDEGNQGYFSQIGINGSQAQKELTLFLIKENEKMNSANMEPTHEDQIGWLNKMYVKFKGCSIKYNHMKGMTVKTDIALLGDKRCHKKH